MPPGYELVSRLGAGQTSVVWLATNPRLGHVALKLPRPGLQNQNLLRRMFENEVQLTLSLRHQNLVAGLEGRPTGPEAFLALEYCAGGTLDQLLLERGRLPLELAVQLISHVAGGLAASHRSQVLHRDVKPANVFLTADGVAKLGDFGTGNYMTDERPDRVGTAFYMAPEIFQGGLSTAASDMYSLGILAYEVLTGARPFVGESLDEIMHAHLNALPKPLDFYRSDIPRPLSAVISRTMSREPGRRYAGVAEFQKAFDAASGVQSAPQAMATGRASRQPPKPGKDELGDDARRRWFDWFRRRNTD